MTATSSIASPPQKRKTESNFNSCKNPAPLHSPQSESAHEQSSFSSYSSAFPMQGHSKEASSSFRPWASRRTDELLQSTSASFSSMCLTESESIKDKGDQDSLREETSTHSAQASSKMDWKKKSEYKKEEHKYISIHLRYLWQF